MRAASPGAARIDVRLEGYPGVVGQRSGRAQRPEQWRAASGSAESQWPLAAGGACAVLANGGRFYLSVDEDFSPGRLHALDADDGQVLWERPLQARRPHQMQAAPGDDVILAEVKDDSTGYALARWRASDGTQSWNVEVPAALLSLGGSSAALSVAWASATAPQARFQQYNPDTGALLATAQEDVRSFQPQAVVAAAIQGQACAAVAVDAPLAYVDVHCRHRCQRRGGVDEVVAAAGGRRADHPAAAAGPGHQPNVGARVHTPACHGRRATAGPPARTRPLRWCPALAEPPHRSDVPGGGCRCYGLPARSRLHRPSGVHRCHLPGARTRRDDWRRALVQSRRYGAPGSGRGGPGWLAPGQSLARLPRPRYRQRRRCLAAPHRIHVDRAVGVGNQLRRNRGQV